MFPENQNLNNHVLTIRHSLDGFSFAVFDLESNRFIFVKDVCEPNLPLPYAIKWIESHYNCSLSDFNKITVLFDNEKHTVVPSSLFNLSAKDKYLELLGISEQDGVVCNDVLYHAELNNVFSVARDDFDFVSQTQHNMSYHHASSVLLTSIISDNVARGVNIQGVYLHIKENKFDMTIVDGCNLLFNNTFKYKTKEDFLYFLLFAIDMLHLDAATVPVFFLGMIEDKSQIVELVSRYVRDIRFVRRDNAIAMSEEMEETPFYYHYILFKSILCEL